MFGMRTSGVLLGEFPDLQKIEKLRIEGLLKIQGNKVFPTST